LCPFASFHFILLLTPPSCLLLYRPLCGSRSLWMFSSVLSLRRQNSGEDLSCLLRRTCFLLPEQRCALLLMSFSPLFLSPWNFVHYSFVGSRFTFGNHVNCWSFVHSISPSMIIGWSIYCRLSIPLLPNDWVIVTKKNDTWMLLAQAR